MNRIGLLILLWVTIAFQACAPSKFTFSDDYIFSQVRNDVFTLSHDDMMGRETGTEGEIMAAKHIMSQFLDIGLQAFPSLGGYLQPFVFSANPHFNPEHGHPIGNAIGHNVVGYIDNAEDEWIVMGAHYDHLGMGGPYSRAPDMHAVHNGADDNASGVAAMLAVARKLRNEKLDANVLLIAFSGEEFGLWGSKHFVGNLPIKKEAIRFMVNFDMVGRMSPEKELVIHGSGTSPIWNDLLDVVNLEHNLELIKKESGSGPSDHASFYKNDIPVLFFFTGQHEDYHKPSDDAEKINLKGIVQIASISADLIKATDDYDDIPFTKTKEPEQTRMDFKVTLGVTPDYVYQGTGLKIDGVRKGRPAANAGVQAGDIVVKIGQTDIKDIYEYMKVLGKYSQGQSTTIVVKRGEEMIELPLTW